MLQPLLLSLKNHLSWPPPCIDANHSAIVALFFDSAIVGNCLQVSTGRRGVVTTWAWNSPFSDDLAGSLNRRFPLISPLFPPCICRVFCGGVGGGSPGGRRGKGGQTLKNFSVSRRRQGRAGREGFFLNRNREGRRDRMACPVVILCGRRAEI